VLLRIAILVAVFVLVAAAVLVWRRPPRRLDGRRLDLDDLGVTGPAIIQFKTRVCATCRAAAPVLHETAVDEAVRYAQVDVGERPEVARAYGIRTVPTIAVADRQGRVLGVWTGVPLNGEVAQAARRARSTSLGHRAE
jgi:hypothetical protein